MKTYFVLFLFGLVTIVACTTIKTNTSKRLDIYGAGVIQKPVIVDLVVKETKITGYATGSALENVKSMAIANAISKANVDVLVEPVFEISTSGGKTTVTVVGFPGYYKNFRPMLEEDINIINIGYVNYVRTEEVPLKKKNKK